GARGGGLGGQRGAGEPGDGGHQHGGAPAEALAERLVVGEEGQQDGVQQQRADPAVGAHQDSGLIADQRDHGAAAPAGRTDRMWTWSPRASRTRRTASDAAASASISAAPDRPAACTERMPGKSARLAAAASSPSPETSMTTPPAPASAASSTAGPGSS